MIRILNHPAANNRLLLKGSAILKRISLVINATTNRHAKDNVFGIRHVLNTGYTMQVPDNC